MRAPFNDATLPFQFEYLPRGHFTTESQYGSISLSQFSLIGICMIESEEWDTLDVEDENTSDEEDGSQNSYNSEEENTSDEEDENTSDEEYDSSQESEYTLQNGMESNILNHKVIKMCVF